MNKKDAEMHRRIPDFKRWESEIKKPFWYKVLVPEFRELMKELKNGNQDDFEHCKEATYAFFETHLLQGTIALATSGEDWDRERKPIDTVVVHHTSNSPGMRLSRLEAIELIRLYAPQYEQKENREGIFSGHFRNRRQVFYPYHWFVREDGTVERLLLDSEIGWHAGNWGVNCRSIAICFDGDFEETRPSEIELASAARIIHEHYTQVPKTRIFGHCEIKREVQEDGKKTETTCPSSLFLTTEKQRGWKDDLIGLL